MTTGSITAQPVNLETPPGVQTASQCLAWAKTAFLKSNIIDPGTVEAPNWATHALQRQGPPAFPFVFFLKSLSYVLCFSLFFFIFSWFFFYFLYCFKTKQNEKASK